LSTVWPAERWRAHIAQFTRQGQLFLQRAKQGSSEEKAIGAWYSEVVTDLGKHDPTGALTVRLEENGPDSPSHSPVMNRSFLTGRVEMLCEYLKELA